MLQFITGMKGQFDRRKRSRSFFRRIIPLSLAGIMIFSSPLSAAAGHANIPKAAIHVNHYVTAQNLLSPATDTSRWEGNVSGRMISTSLFNPAALSHSEKMFRAETVPEPKQLILGDEQNGRTVILSGSFGKVKVTAEPIRLIIRPQTSIDHLYIAEELIQTSITVGKSSVITEWSGWKPETVEPDLDLEIGHMEMHNNETIHHSRPRSRNSDGIDSGGNQDDEIDPIEEPGNDPDDSSEDSDIDDGNGTNPGDNGEEDGDTEPDDDQDPGEDPVDDNSDSDPDSPFDGGWGTAENPYRIAKTDHLLALIHYDPLETSVHSQGSEEMLPEMNYLNAHYVMVDNINLQGVQVKPIGTSEYFFSGHFDGQGHTVKGLKIEETGVGTAGFFAGIGTGGKIKNLTIAEPDVKGNRHVGVLAGVNKGHIERVNIIGTIPLVNNGRNTTGIDISEFSTGGLVGSNHAGGIVKSCHVQFTIHSPNTLPQIGMLAGINQGYIEQSSTIGRIMEAHTRQGGLVGYNNGGIIKNSYANVDLATLINRRGGLVGHDEGSEGTIENCYAEGYVGTVSRFNARVGYLIGSQHTEHHSYIESAYYNLGDSETTPLGQLGTALTREEMAEQNSFAGFDFDQIWVMAGEGADRRPRLRCEPQ